MDFPLIIHKMKLTEGKTAHVNPTIQKQNYDTFAYLVLQVCAPPKRINPLDNLANLELKVT